MKKILLTSAGLENKVVENKFMELIGKKAKEIRVLFITTAAVETEAIQVLPKCLDDLLNVGIPMENITVYDMHQLIGIQELKKQDAIYVCGGNTSYLVERIDEIGFQKVVDQYLEEGGVYLGVSAGSVVASGKYKTGLNFIKNSINVHCEKSSKNGKILNEEVVNLTDNQAILITDSESIIFE